MKKIFIALFVCFILSGCGSGCIEGDCANGFGTYTNIYGDMYVGDWKDDEKNGQGTYTWSNGDKYVGEHTDDKKNGQGTLTFADGTIYHSGLWENNEPVK